MRRLAAVCLFALTLLPSIAFAEGAADLAGTWKREDGKLYRFDVDQQTGELAGKMLEPPAADEAKTVFYSVDIRLKVDGAKVEGKATWTEPNPKKGKPGQPDSWSAGARWELTVKAAGTLEGKTEWLDWAEGVVSDRGFDNHSFTLLPVISLAGAGDAPAKVDAGLAVDPAALAGTWKTPNGTYVTFKAPSDPLGFVVERVAGEGRFPQSIKLTNDGNVLRGIASWAEGETGVELKLSSAGKLEGRTERLEGEKDKSTKTWAPWSLERLVRVDGTSVAGEPSALPAGTADKLPLELKREDGLYLVLARNDDGSYKGELVKKGEGKRGTVELAPAGENRFAGKATFTTDAGPVEVKWELAVVAEGTVEGRCEWMDWDAAAKKAIVHGSVAHKFKALRRVG